MKLDAPVLIVGGGPVGLTLAALLAAFGVAAIVVEADAGYCTGSRAICISRRSQEVFGWIGADAALTQAGLPWTGGRSYHRDREVLHFTMPSEAGERFAPMLNLQQYRVEAIADEALQRAAHHRGLASTVHWQARLLAVAQGADGVTAEIEHADGRRDTLRAAWLVACDGGRSTVRELLGLQLHGTQYEGRYVIADIEQKSTRPVERLAWFDPPSNPGSTLLMHRQPGDVWRIDYQIRDDEDPAQAILPENVWPRVASHLAMIGETAPWKPLWISIYNAKCLTLDDYRHGRVLLAGDAAHLVPIFGVRGLNSGLDDAGNLAWKLAAVLNGAPDRLLDSYNTERRGAALENMAFGAKSTEFMAPPNFAFKLMREAALRLAAHVSAVRSLINPRQSTPVAYAGSALNHPDTDADWQGGAAPGTPAPDALLRTRGAARHLSRVFGAGHTLLWFTRHAAIAGDLLALERDRPIPVRVCVIRPDETSDTPDDFGDGYSDPHGQAWQRFEAREGTLYLIRPDAYVLGRWRAPRWADVHSLLEHL